MIFNNCSGCLCEDLNYVKFTFLIDTLLRLIFVSIFRSFAIDLLVIDSLQIFLIDTLSRIPSLKHSIKVPSISFSLPMAY